MANFNCIALTSSISGSDDDDTTYVECNDNYPTMTSCGYRADPDNEHRDNYDGGYMTKVNGVNRCYAQNGNGGTGIYAKARCCDFTHLGDVECVASNFGYVSGDDETIAGSCSNSYPFLTGCVAVSNTHSADGCYPGAIDPESATPNTNYASYQQQCTAVSGASGIYIYTSKPLFCYYIKTKWYTKKTKQKIRICLWICDML